MMTAAEKGEVVKQLYLRDMNISMLAYELGYSKSHISKVMDEISSPIELVIFKYLGIDRNCISEEPVICTNSKELAAEVKKQLSVQDINCSELADKAGLAHLTISAFFNRKASVKTECLIAEALGIPITNPFYHEVRIDEIYHAQGSNARCRV